MVIDTNNIGSSGSSRSRATPTVTTVAPKTPTTHTEKVTTTSKDNVVLSPEAQNLSRLQSKIKQLPDVNLERVAAIKQAIADGRFEINADRIAQNMLNQDELLN
jgi:negative regulator of flagellin synthesis FlgM